MRAAPGFAPRPIARLSRRIDMPQIPQRPSGSRRTMKVALNPGAVATVLVGAGSRRKGFAKALRERTRRLYNATAPSEGLTGDFAMPLRVCRLLAAIAAVLTGWQALGQAIPDEPQPDSTFWARKDDPDMLAAMRAARATLPAFLALARAPRESMSLFTVKVPIRDGDHVEYFWITPFTEENGRFSGKVDNDPQSIKTVKYGDTISFGEQDIVDWSYVDGEKMRGNYTLCAMLKQGSRRGAEAFIRRYRMDCEL